jgi:hypothetical protein
MWGSKSKDARSFLCRSGRSSKLWQKAIAEGRPNFLE